MTTFRTFEDIDAWQKARKLIKTIYAITKQSPFCKDFALRDQIRRASVSIASNIAEGFERDGKGEFIQFLSIAKGSAGEIKTQLYIALDQQYIDKEVFDETMNIINDVGSMLGGLINYLRDSNIAGIKYNKENLTRN